jgi:aspartyl-tRNA(Asn)/glutamyl-tRNA(Gln) amidotransferase subunit A
MYLADIMTVAANLTGIPAMSLPIKGSDNLPLGLQIMAPQSHESTMFAAAGFAETTIKTQLEAIRL